MMVSLPPDYRPTEDEEFMNPLQVEYFRQKLLRWRADLLREADGTLASLSRGRYPRSRYHRSGQRRDRPGAGTADPGPRPQADLQDRPGAGADRGRHLRLLRGNRRTDWHQAAGGPPDRHDVDRGAGAAREDGAGPPRRLIGRRGGLRHSAAAEAGWPCGWSNVGLLTGSQSIRARACGQFRNVFRHPLSI